MTGTKLCLRKCSSRECANHTPGHPLVTDDTLYVCSATSGTALTTVFREPTLAITGLEKELVEYIVEAEDGEGPLSARSLFSWLQENDIKTTESFTEAVEIHENARALPLKTPAKRRIERDTAREIELDNDDSEPAVKAVVEAMVSYRSNKNMFVLPGVLSSLFLVGIGLLFSATLASAQDGPYVIGTDGDQACPAGSEPILDADECRVAAAAPNVVAIYTDGFQYNCNIGNVSPPGCHGLKYENRFEIYFNTDLESTGSGTTVDETPICKRIPVSTAGG